MRSLLFIKILSLQVLLVSASYELLVEILSLSNPDGRCADQYCGVFCCDGRCPALGCDYYFLLCQKSAGSPISYSRSVNPHNCSTFTSNTIENASTNVELNIFSRSIFDSQVIFTGDEWPSDGIQIHLEVNDLDSGSGNDELIDRFVINATLTVGTTVTHVLSGIFGFAEVSVSLTLRCADNFYDTNCNIFCSGNCSCDPGLTGPYCSESIDECDGAICEENQLCEDGHLNFTCVCEAGYTGSDCTVDIDECAGVNCSFGTCHPGRGFFTCVCSPGYTGMFCDEEMDSYQVQITVDSVRNPDGMCADERCVQRNTCCDSVCPRARCDYFLQYCQIDIRSPVYNERSIFQHDSCMALTTLPESHGTSLFSFTSSQNTLTLSGREWPMEGIQVVVDLIDADGDLTHELVDRFVITITSTNQTSEFHMGIFGLADLNITIEVMDISGMFPPTVLTPATTTRKNPSTAFTLPYEISPSLSPATTSDTVFTLPTTSLPEILTGSSAGVIIASTVTSAVVVTILLVTVAVFAIWKLKFQKAKFASSQQKVPVLPLTISNYEYTGPPVSSARDTNLQSPAKRVRVGSRFVKDMSKKDLVITASNIELLEIIGKGEFGVVYKGHLTEWKGRSAPELVAVKTLKDILSPKDVRDLINESEMMTKFDHLNVLRLIGVCIDAGEAPYLVMPYMANGSLLKYLRKERPQLTIKETTSENSMQVADVTEKLLFICFQIAQGMCYLAEKKFVHRDLAARNCMISEDFVIKVADFGLAEDIYCCDYFRQNHVSGAEEAPVKLPVKWMALESLLDDIFTEKTDVWSYGVTCWEVFSLGRTPYPGVDPFSLIKFLKNGGRLEKPSNPACTDQVFFIIEKCWDEVPDKRLSFKELESALKPLFADKSKQWH